MLRLLRIAALLALAASLSLGCSEPAPPATPDAAAHDAGLDAGHEQDAALDAHVEVDAHASDAGADAGELASCGAVLECCEAYAERGMATCGRPTGARCDGFELGSDECEAALVDVYDCVARAGRSGLVCAIGGTAFSCATCAEARAHAALACDTIFHCLPPEQDVGPVGPVTPYVPPPCDRVDAAEADVFRRVLGLGASNTRTFCPAEPCLATDVRPDAASYVERVARQAHLRLAGCVDFVPVITTSNDFASPAPPADTTLVLSFDGLFHLIDEEDFPTTGPAFFAGIRESAPDAHLLVAIIPRPWIPPEHADAHTQITRDQIALSPRHHEIDLDALVTLILAGRVVHGGTAVTLESVLLDGVHLDEYGHELVADLMIARLNELFPSLELPTARTLEIR